MRLVPLLTVLALLLTLPGPAPPGPPPAGMVLVPGGPCLVGHPPRQVHVPAFFIDVHETTNAQVRAVRPDWTVPPGRENHPAVGLTRPEAEAVLAALGKRLPTGLEWEKAARGTDGRTYPWGEAPPEGRANVGRLQAHTCNTLKLEPVGSFPAGESPYGCLDMIGNAFEWCSDDDPGPPTRHVLRGGAVGYPERYNKTWASALEDTGVT